MTTKEIQQSVTRSHPLNSFPSSGRAKAASVKVNLQQFPCSASRTSPSRQIAQSNKGTLSLCPKACPAAMQVQALNSRKVTSPARVDLGAQPDLAVADTQKLSQSQKANPQVVTYGAARVIPRAMPVVNTSISFPKKLLLSRSLPIAASAVPSTRKPDSARSASSRLSVAFHDSPQRPTACRSQCSSFPGRDSPKPPSPSKVPVSPKGIRRVAGQGSPVNAPSSARHREAVPEVLSAAPPPTCEVSSVTLSKLQSEEDGYPKTKRVGLQLDDQVREGSNPNSARRSASEETLHSSINSSSVQRVTSFSRPYSYAAEKHLKLTESGVQTTCPKCGRVLGENDTTPLTLLCGHSLCAVCCTKQMEDDTVSCPSCHHLTALGGQGLAALQTNYALGSLVCLSLDEIERMTTAEALDNIGATCAMCLEAYSTALPPYLLACGHSMCETCCTADIKECPMCRATLQEVNINKPLIKVVEALGNWKHRPACEVPRD
eukprot:GGOE01005581.1.p1 GENE.GGOE01005581.1~~GGOE01005581.1.p1  ORF type:complete len:500 (-),score=38.32 GGOE01005581.1:736-2205(-)